MAVLDFRNLVINSILAMLFLTGILIINLNLSTSNGVPSVLLSDPDTNVTLQNLTVILTGTQDVTTTQREGFESEVPQVGTDSFLFESVIGGTKTFSSVMSALGNVAISYIIRGLGLNEGQGLIINAAIISILTILIILLAWKILKTGF